MDALLIAADTTLRTFFAPARATRATPKSIAQAAPQSPNIVMDANPTAELSEAEKQHAAGLMRVNHVGEICAQALYTSQALVTKNPDLRKHFMHAASEEEDHLAWTEERLKELGSRTSLLNPLWYAGAFAIGCVAGKIGGDRVSLGFVVETENQVEAHLQSHLDQLPEGDAASRAIVQQMKEDEAQHAAQALDAGAVQLPSLVQGLMRSAAKVMTTLAYKI